ncbi:MerC family mercury resistance protein, partial [Pseudomonas aeruginosa]
MRASASALDSSAIALSSLCLLHCLALPLLAAALPLLGRWEQAEWVHVV